ncbi:ABC transporter permease [Fulvivirga kasyanovii]|uniref:ABC transporter permease n=1 Tax=Fulvivirga kasyanovii TaxID=396812 RepID=A0ABW9RHQ3_9BACT|nr:ABC transporter permease [Fulvivirga kasyanovii]MTI23589.1 ABC transporter permease [Fulvivirga kasyanovii]
MLKNYLRTFIQDTKKNLTISVVSMIGITLALAAFIAILQVLIFESSFDKFHSNKDNVYRVLSTSYADGELENYWPCVPKLMGEYCKDYSGVQDFARTLENWPGVNVAFDQKYFRTTERSYYVDASFLDVMNFEILHGNKSSLKNINTCFITESFSQKIFGQVDNVVGKVLSWNEGTEVTIGGVLKDIPQNSSFQFEILLSMETFPYLRNMDWENNTVFGLFLKLDKSVNLNSFSHWLTQLHYDNHNFEAGRKVKYELQPIDDMHLRSGKLTYDYLDRGNLELMHFLLLVSISIVVISLINYVNISSTKLFNRTKEVGIRKLFGAVKASFVKQFFLESVIFNVICALAAFVLLSIPQISNLFDAGVGANGDLSLTFFTVLLSVIFISSLSASAVPSVAILSYSLSALLKGEMVRKQKVVNANTLFISIQLFLCVGFIALTFTIFKQFDFMVNNDLGVKIESVLLVTDKVELEDRRSKNFRSELLNYPEVQSVTSSYVPGKQVLTTKVVNKEGSQKSIMMNATQIDYDYLETFSIKLIAGRNLSEEYPSDRNGGALINRSALDFFDFKTPEEALNKRIFFDGVKTYTIVGVIDDFHQVSLKDKIEPSTYVYQKWPSGYFSIKIQPGSFNQQTISRIKAVYDRIYPEFSFDYQLLEEQYLAQYRQDKVFNKIISALSFIAIVLCCLGLWTMTEFNLRKKAKEIAVRKVLGATIWNIFEVHLKYYGILLLVSAILSLPLVYFISDNWLDNYAYRISIGNWFFILPVLILLPFILLSIIRSIYVAAIRSPIESIRADA